MRLSVLAAILVAGLSSPTLAQVVAPLGPGNGAAGGGGGGGGGTPGGSNTQVQYNNSGTFGGISGWTTDGANILLGGASATLTAGSTITGGTFVPTANTIPTDGMYLNAAGQTAFAAGSARIFFFNSTGLLMNNASGATLIVGAAAATTPSVVPRRSDSGTGMGSAGTASLSLIASSIEQFRVNNGSIYVGGAATGTNTAAVAPTISGALSTGTGTNPDLVFQTGVKTTTGTAQATATTALTIKGETQALVAAVSLAIGAGSAITSSGAGGALGTNAFTSTAYLPLTGGTITGLVTHSGAGVAYSGAISQAAWTTTGLIRQHTAATLTDTSSSGTVAAAYTNAFGGNTIAASSATTYTRYVGANFTTPVAGTNVTMTSAIALAADNVSIGGAAIGTNVLAVAGLSNLNGGTLGSSSTASFITVNGTWNDAGTTFKGALLVNVINTNSSTSSLLQDWQIGGASQAALRRDGTFIGAFGFGSSFSTFRTYVGDSFQAATSKAYGWTAGTDATGALVTSLSQDSSGVININSSTVGNKLGSINLTNLIATGTITASGSGQLNVAAMTQTATAQSGTVCYNSGTGAITYDATVGCLTSTLTEKDDWQDITPQEALAVVLKMQAGSYTYKVGRGLPKGPQIGLAAEQLADIDDRLVGHRPDGSLQGVRYSQASALYPMAIQALRLEIEELKKQLH